MPTGDQNRSRGKDTSLFSLVFQEILKSPAGSISFARYMELALYHPDQGYYAHPLERKIGRKGDFFTSVSVGETFGLLLAYGIVKAWRKAGGGPWVVVEQGAHDGQLARDILAGLDEIGSGLERIVEYRIIEPRDSIREQLADHAAQQPDARLQVVPSIAAARAPAGIFLCNELLDAFPVALVLRRQKSWVEKRVCRQGEGLGWTEEALTPDLERIIQAWGNDPEEGFQAELCPGLEAWVGEVSGLFEQGYWWVFDYGYEIPERLLAARRDGTLRCYEGHRASVDPLDRPGQLDITAHANFTSLAAAAQAAGLEASPLTDQHRFLIEIGRPWLLSLEGTPPTGRNAARLRQWQTLTHPSLMGQQFRVARFTKGLLR